VVDKVKTIAGMEYIARQGELYFNLHTRGQAYFGDNHGQIYPLAAADGELQAITRIVATRHHAGVTYSLAWTGPTAAMRRPDSVNNARGSAAATARCKPF
jgi:hypothetical protein